MAAKAEQKDAITVTSTGAVPYDESPIERTAIADNSSTGAVETPGDTVIIVDHLNQPAVVRVPTPGPITIESPWHARTKVIEPAGRHAADPAETAAETK